MRQREVAAVIRDQRRSRRIQFWLGLVVIAAVGVAWAGLTREPLDEFGGVFGGPFGVPEPPIFVDDMRMPIPVPAPAMPAPVLIPTPEPFDG